MKVRVLRFRQYINQLHSDNKNPTLRDAKEWLLEATGASLRRKKALAVRTLGRWCEEAGIEYFSWWRQVPLAITNTSGTPYSGNRARWRRS